MLPIIQRQGPFKREQTWRALWVPKDFELHKPGWYNWLTHNKCLLSARCIPGIAQLAGDIAVNKRTEAWPLTGNISEGHSHWMSNFTVCWFSRGLGGKHPEERETKSFSLSCSSSPNIYSFPHIVRTFIKDSWRADNRLKNRLGSGIKGG